MHLVAKWALLAFAGAFVFTGLALGQPVTEKPDWKVGDSWEYQQTIMPGDKAATWSRKIEALLPGDKLQVRFENGKLEQYDAALNFMSDGRADGVRTLARYPLKLGSDWTFSANIGTRPAAENGSAKVVAYESVTVPAGTFNCYRIDAVSDFVNKSYRERRVWNRWYCPDVKWIAKERLETTIETRDSPGSKTVATSELVKFTPGN